ncbi:MAG: sulfur carrier protein ThiS [Candidatus Marinamargulisbacteria bacterium]
MNIQINGEKETLDAAQLTVSELLTLKSVKMPDMVSVELNGDILDREAFDTTVLKNDDVVEFLYFMGGGALY